ncbi:hypothetical protein QCA50_005865 [Cerrena zonata]|uniref:HNH nuclease domain-containing protein n=1 Tax=Cerrena zonata TaxID=2478898 RepID=A0AAW0GMI1_9APHY
MSNNVSPHIDVYVSLPTTVPSDSTKLPNLAPENWTWKHLLRCPVSKLAEFTLSAPPYMWLRYSTYAILGAEGRLSTQKDLLDEPIYTKELPLESKTLYYHYENANEQARLFPLESDLMNPRSMTSQVTQRFPSFKNDVLDRDNGRCVVTDSFYSDASHLIAHSKGDEYIRALTERRSRRSTDVVPSIDHVRNGLTLYPSTHSSLARAHAAFMKVPNFAIQLADIDTPLPDNNADAYIAHAFVPSINIPFGARSPGSLLRIPQDRSQWPPDILFDALYGGVVLQQFGVCKTEDLDKPWEHVYYPNGKIASQEFQKILRDAEAEDEDELKEEGYQLDPNDPLDYMTFILPYSAMSPESLQASRRAAEEKRQQQLHGRVSEWASHV